MKFWMFLCNLCVFLVCFTGVATSSKPVTVTEANWERLLSSDEWMVKFYAPWCPACNRLEPTWNEYSEKIEELKIRVGSADVNANPVLSGLFSVTSLPTIYHIKDGQYRVYEGPRDIQSLTNFIKNKEWEKIEPSSSWLTPNSFLIRTLSLLFKATLYFKDLYAHLNESYGLPTWAVLTLFVCITIMIGLGLGIALIILIDCVFPPKKYSKEELNETIPEDIIADDEDEKEEHEVAEASKTKAESSDPPKRRTRAKKDD